ncbi:MAG: ABC transporter ATP-binding protein [Thermodesulfobacteriota bacterium]
MSLLEIKEIESGYGRTPIIHGVNLEVAGGELVALVGPNGAGKTTLLRTIAGLLKFTQGRITLSGRSLSGLRPNEIVNLGLGYVLQTQNVFPNLTVRENLEMGAYLLPEAEFKDKLTDVFDRFPILKERLKQKAGTLSGGQRQMLAIASSILLTPKLLMLDEPCGGLAPQIAEEVHNKILDIHRTGTAILWVVEREIEIVLKIVSRSYALESGRITFCGAGEELLCDSKYQELILGSAGNACAR